MPGWDSRCGIAAGCWHDHMIVVGLKVVSENQKETRLLLALGGGGAYVSRLDGHADAEDQLLATAMGT
jgi:hypothetical protein